MRNVLQLSFGNDIINVEDNWQLDTKAMSI